MHYMRKAMIPWIGLIGLGVCCLGIAIMEITSSTIMDITSSTIIDNIAIFFVFLSIGSIFTASGAFIIGRISAFLFIEKSGNEQRKKLYREKT